MGVTVLHDRPLLAKRVQLSPNSRSVFSLLTAMTFVYLKLVDRRGFVSCCRNLAKVLDVTGILFNSAPQQPTGHYSLLVRDTYAADLASCLRVKQSLVSLQSEPLSRLRIVDEEQIDVVCSVSRHSSLERAFHCTCTRARTDT